MGSRTPDLLIANETLYQLSYDPIPQEQYYALETPDGKYLHINDRSATVLVVRPLGRFPALNLDLRAPRSSQ